MSHDYHNDGPSDQVCLFIVEEKEVLLEAKEEQETIGRRGETKSCEKRRLSIKGLSRS